MEEATGDLLADAAAHGGLGLPLPRETRLRALKRLVARFQRLTTHHQVAYNEAILEALQVLRVQVLALSTSLSEVRDAHATQIANLSVTLRSEIATLVEQLMTHEAHAGITGARLDASFESLNELAGRLQRTREQVAALETDQQRSHERDLAARAIERLRVVPPRAGSMVPVREPAVLPDAVSFALEEAFRGPFEDVRERLRVHLDTVRAASQVGPVLDVGCGRGEWLSILQEAGLESYGVDSNALAIEHCRALRLDVLEGDLLEHLGKCADASLGAITAFHIVEHLPLDVLLMVFSHAVRVLRPGGVLVIETPNVANIKVGASMFHLDPTHISALHPLLLEFLLAAHGFSDVELQFLQPSPPLEVPPAASPELAHVIAAFNELMFSAQDVAAVGWRPGD